MVCECAVAMVQAPIKEISLRRLLEIQQLDGVALAGLLSLKRPEIGTLATPWSQGCVDQIAEPVEIIVAKVGKPTDDRDERHMLSRVQRLIGDEKFSDAAGQDRGEIIDIMLFR